MRAGTRAAPGAGDAAPWLVIDAAQPRKALDLAELWRYRDLLYFLTWRDVAARYKQTALGFLWATSRARSPAARRASPATPIS